MAPRALLSKSWPKIAHPAGSYRWGRGRIRDSSFSAMLLILLAKLSSYRPLKTPFTKKCMSKYWIRAKVLLMPTCNKQHLYLWVFRRRSCTSMQSKTAGAYAIYCLVQTLPSGCRHKPNCMQCARPYHPEKQKPTRCSSEEVLRCSSWHRGLRKCAQRRRPHNCKEQGWCQKPGHSEKWGNTLVALTIRWLVW